MDPDIKEIVANVTTMLKAQVGAQSPNKDVLTSCEGLLNAAAALSKALPVNSKLSFSLTVQEYLILLVYGLGGLTMMWIVPQVITNVAWTGTDVLNVLLYWTTIMAVLLGASAVPKALASASQGAGGGASQ
jgi:hypothetical protein